MKKTLTIQKTRQVILPAIITEQEGFKNTKKLELLISNGLCILTKPGATIDDILRGIDVILRDEFDACMEKEEDNKWVLINEDKHF